MTSVANRVTARGCDPGDTADRDLLAQWLGEEAQAAADGPVPTRAVHAARRRLYLDMLRAGGTASSSVA